MGPLVQVIGALLVLTGFALAQAKLLTPQARAYLVVNAVGATVLAATPTSSASGDSSCSKESGPRSPSGDSSDLRVEPPVPPRGRDTSCASARRAHMQRQRPEPGIVEARRSVRPNSARERRMCRAPRHRFGSGSARGGATVAKLPSGSRARGVCRARVDAAVRVGIPGSGRSRVERRDSCRQVSPRGCCARLLAVEIPQQSTPAGSPTSKVSSLGSRCSGVARPRGAATSTRENFSSLHSPGHLIVWCAPPNQRVSPSPAATVRDERSVKGTSTPL